MEKDVQGRVALMAALTARLTRVRGDLTEPEFALLLTNVTLMHERFAEIDAKPGASLPEMSVEEIRRLVALKPSA